MAETRKVLGQLIPAATTLIAVYTVPAATQAVVSSIMVCNQEATAKTFRVSIAVAGAADNEKQYILFDHALDGNTSFEVTIGITLAATDVIRVYSSATKTSFNVFGVEIT